jgi:hypothetical protein
MHTELMNRELSTPRRADASTQPVGHFALGFAFTGFILTVLTFYPGFLTKDSFDQYLQARTFRFTAWHPPMMALVWSAADAVWPGPQLMLLLQALGYWGGVYGLLRALSPSRSVVLVAIGALLCSPAILNYIGVVWKDVQLAAVWSFVLGCAFALRMRGKPPGVAATAGLLALVVYGALVRFNSGLVAGPLVLYVLTGRARLVGLWSTAAAYLWVAVLVAGLSQGVNRALEATHTQVVEALMTFDLTGVAISENGSNPFPFPLEPGQLDALARCYGDGAFQNPLVWGDCRSLFEKVKEVAVADPWAMRSAWASAVLHDPAAYLSHRFRHFAYFLAPTRSIASDTFWVSEIRPNPYGVYAEKLFPYPLLQAYVRFFSSTILFRPATWLAASLLLLAYAAGFRKDDETSRFATTCALIAAAYLMTYLPFGVAYDFRYAYLAIVTTTFGLCAVLGDVRLDRLWQSPNFRAERGHSEL